MMYQLIQKYPSVILKGENSLLRLSPVSGQAVRITMTVRDHFLEGPNPYNDTPVVPDKTPWTEYTLTETEASVTLNLPDCRVEAQLATGRLRYFGPDGALLAEEPETQGKTLDEIDVYRNEFSGEGDYQEVRTVDGVKITGGDFRRVFDRKACHARVSFVFGDEALYGFGSHEEGCGNLRGKSRELYQQNMKACVPFFVSTKGYGFLFDCRSLMNFEDNEFGSYVFMDTVDELDYYFLAGGSYARVSDAYRKLTGQAPMLPRWAYGYGQSKERYVDAQELISVVQEYRRRKIPLSFIVQDWQTWEEGLWGQKSFDYSRYPDPDGLTETLHDMGAAMMISVWPRFSGGGANQQEMMEQGYLLGDHSIYDAFRKEARELYWKQARDGLFCHGVDGWWCDATEPFECDWFGQHRMEHHERQNHMVAEAKKYLDDGEICAYSLAHSRGIYEGQRRDSDKRVVNLTRSSFAGQHRYAAVTWSGDISANWETLEKQIPEGLNFSAAGEPWWNLDIGGFFVRKRDLWFWKGDYPGGCEDLGYRELYTRWLEYAAFLPMMRSHGTDTPREIWRFGEPGTPFYDAIARFIRLRMAMMPYIYSQAAAVTLKNDTFMTALGLAFPEDRTAWNIKNQYLFGPNLMVCPVTRPMYYGPESTPLEGVEKTRQVYLPAGCGWYDLWTGEQLSGGQTVCAQAPLDRIPLYVRAGSILPIGPAEEYSGQVENPELTLYVYPGADASFDLYDDEGDSYRYEAGAFRITPLRWNEADRILTLGPARGSYPGMAERRRFRVVCGKQEQTLELGTEAAVLSF